MIKSKIIDYIIIGILFICLAFFSYALIIAEENINIKIDIDNKTYICSVEQLDTEFEYDIDYKIKCD